MCKWLFGRLKRGWKDNMKKFPWAIDHEGERWMELDQNYVQWKKFGVSCVSF
jgi:hypothetical protein